MCPIKVPGLDRRLYKELMFPCLSFNHLFWTDFDEIGLLVSIVVVVTLFRSHKDTLLGLVRLVLLSRVFGLAP